MNCLRLLRPSSAEILLHLVGASYSLFLWWRLLCLKIVDEREDEDGSAAYDTISSYLCTLLLFVAVKNAYRRLYMNIPTVTSSTSLLNRFHPSPLRLR